MNSKIIPHNSKDGVTPNSNRVSPLASNLNLARSHEKFSRNVLDFNKIIFCKRFVFIYILVSILRWVESPIRFISRLLIASKIAR